MLPGQEVVLVEIFSSGHCVRHPTDEGKVVLRRRCADSE